MRATGLVAWAMLLLIAAPGAAHASAPVPGGRYVDRIHEQGASGRVNLTLANDGLEFAVPSDIRVGRCGFLVFLTGSGLEPEAVAVDSDGRFRTADRWGAVRGRFISGGRLAVGRATGFGSPTCRRHISVRFRARLTGTPNAARPGLPSSCDPVTIFEIPRGDDHYTLAEQGIGCTTARRLARQWHASPECAAFDYGRCDVFVGRGDVREHRDGSLAAPRQYPMLDARAPGGAVELVYHRACRAAPRRRARLRLGDQPRLPHRPHLPAQTDPRNRRSVWELQGHPLTPLRALRSPDTSAQFGMPRPLESRTSVRAASTSRLACARWRSTTQSLESSTRTSNATESRHRRQPSAPLH